MAVKERTEEMKRLLESYLSGKITDDQFYERLKGLVEEQPELIDELKRLVASLQRESSE